MAKAEPKKKHAGGRPTRYRKEFPLQAEKLCRLGATDVQLGDFFGVTEQTITGWKKKYPEFFASIKLGKMDPDDQVERALFQRALGYEHDEDKIFNADGKPLVVPTVKHYPPDTAAAFIWLKNRRPAAWRDKKEIAIEAIDIGKPPTLEDAAFPDDES